MRVGITLDGVLLSYKTSEAFDVAENDMPYGEFGDLLPGAKSFLRGLKEDGWEIVLITDRTELSLVRSHVLNTLKLPIDRVSSPAAPVVCDLYVLPNGLAFQGSWDDSLRKRLVAFRTWEEKKKAGKVKLGASERKKGEL